MSTNPTLLPRLESLLFSLIPTLFAPNTPPPRLVLRNSFHSFHTYLRLIYLASLSHHYLCISRLLTKRDVYYLCRPLFPTPITVHRTLVLLASNLNVPSDLLNIVAAPKALVAGNISFVDYTNALVNVSRFAPDPCLLPMRPDSIRNVVTDARAIVILEKETVFQSLLHDPHASQLLKTCIFITGKGYPDFATRTFLNTISNAMLEKARHLPIYILTDADPHGVSIAFCYIRHLITPMVRWIGICPSHHPAYFQLNHNSLLQVTSSELTLIDTLLRRIPKQPQNKQTILAPLIHQLNFMKQTRVKFEMEALTSNHIHHCQTPLLNYLLLRTQEESYYLLA